MYAIAPPSTPQDTEAETAVEDTAEPVLQLARTFSLTRTFSALSTNINPFLAQDSHLDPKSPDFEPESWVKALLHTFSKDPSKHPRYTAGVSWRNLSVHGFSDPTEFQKDVFNVIWRSPLSALNWFAKRKQKVKIISDFDGLVKSGELLLVLGRPGSGVSTLLKTIAGHTHGLHLDDSSEFNYQDIHFPQLTVGDTLLFAALARTPQHIIANISRHVYAEHMRDAVMAMFGISNTLNTKVGDDFVRGVSGGERKREFDKVLLLYEGRQIFFGPTSEATQYFTAMGFECPPRQTTADFLTSLTNPDERIVRPGFENKVPRSPDEFADEWRMSQHRSSLLSDIAAFEIQYPLDGKQVETLKGIRRAQKAKFTSDKSPFTISIPMQIHLCIGRGVKRLLGDKTFFVVTIAVNFVMSLVLGSVYFDLPSTAEAMNRRASVIFFAILFNGLSSALEILALYVQRPIVEKHARYALYRPLSESVSSIICDLPSKIISTLAFNIPLYFMVHLRRDASAFFIFLLFGFTTTMTMSMILRTIAQSSKTVHQALVPAAIFIIGLVIYAGFVLPIRSMKGWLRWINYVNPIAYAYESLVANEFSGRSFGCQTMIPSGPGYEDIEPMQRTCSVAGALPGRDFIDGDFFMGTVYKYHYSHLWRNVCYDVKVKGETRRILSDVNGWVQPGKLTALMSFQRTTGYVQQQDIHLETSTVREALRFSAALRQPSSVCMQDKIDYVEEVISLLEMGPYADAVIGVSGKGLNVEQRKRLSIGVELVAKPEALIFLDEPTSGLDSQTAWAIVSLLKKLANHGLAILCTIHQPSGIIFQQFDRLLLLAKGGRTVYFGDIGENATALTGYFERHDAVQCRPEENPAEWMLHVIGAAPGAHTDRDWVETWKASSEFHGVQKELDSLAQSRHVTSEADTQDTSYAASVSQQFLACTQRVAQQYWRTPTYIYSKLSLCFITASSPNEHSTKVAKDLQRHMLGTISFSPTQSSKWLGTLWHLWRSTSRSTSSLGTFAHMCVAGAPTAEVGATLGLFLFMMALVFCGVLVPYSSLPGFWTFMYRVSPLTYLIGAMISNGVGKQELTCSEIEFLQFQTPANLTCGEFSSEFLATTNEPERALGQPTSGNVVVSGDAEAVDSHDGAVFGICQWRMEREDEGFT
uniref:ABC transporter domain-containing protein n=1 Tax=Fusarium oxysporum (strain Fo5176) TaxID=660025 RepID=A0A0D2Y6S9_FUSOF